MEKCLEQDAKRMLPSIIWVYNAACDGLSQLTKRRYTAISVLPFAAICAIIYVEIKDTNMWRQ